MANNITGSPATLLPIVGPGGRLPIGPTGRNAPPLSGQLQALDPLAAGPVNADLRGARVSPPPAVGMWPVPLSAAIDSQARGTDPRPRHAAPGQPSATFNG